ncbi:NucA/NucB deoxyribonuclease domain-containing protein [Streptosporangium sp. NPDC023963]|uniref:NucA/NucB deoxyribonuclease domain-containing protein n=1 Tax=Streptosporangium sp. NPDC023963 TaxID=3155608 RepID=UPI00341D65EC
MTPIVWVKVPTPDGGDKAYSVQAIPRTVRCDSSPLIGWYSSGGCVVMRGVVALTMAYNDEAHNPETGVRTSFTDVNDHIWMALEHPYLTKPGRKTFYDLSPNAKDIPGNWGDWLSRAKYRTSPEGSRGIAQTACTIEYSSAQRQGKQCDEFPFASTQQGAHYADPENNFSVMPVNSAQNSAHGKVVGAWYQNNRIIRSDKFWIQLID